LKVPDDDMTLEEKNALYDEQKQKIFNFVELLHDSLITEHGKVLLYCISAINKKITFA